MCASFPLCSEVAARPQMTCNSSVMEGHIKFVPHFIWLLSIITLDAASLSHLFRCQGPFLILDRFVFVRPSACQETGHLSGASVVPCGSLTVTNRESSSAPTAAMVLTTFVLLFFFFFTSLLAEDETRQHLSQLIHVAGLRPPIFICGHQPSLSETETSPAFQPSHHLTFSTVYVRNS